MRVIYKDHKASFVELLETDNCVSLHFKVLGISPKRMNNLFPLNTSSNNNIRNRSTFNLRPAHSVQNGTEVLSHLAPKIWELILNDIKTFDFLPEFKHGRIIEKD